jgi:hypothetical protein
LADVANQAILVLLDLQDLLVLRVKLDLKDCQEVLAAVVRLAREEKEAKLVHLDRPEALA